jgi:hypothetical protein
MTLCRWVSGYRRFGVSYFLHAQGSRSPKQALRVFDSPTWRYNNLPKRRKTIHPITVSHYRRTPVITANVALIFIAFSSYITNKYITEWNKDVHNEVIWGSWKPNDPVEFQDRCTPFYCRCPRPPLILAGSRVADEIRLLARFSHRSDPLIARGRTTVVIQKSSLPHFTLVLTAY